MNKRITGGVLAAALAAGLCVPAQAISAAPGAAICMTTAAAMQRVSSRVKNTATPGIQGSTLAFDDVERVVRAKNTSIQAFNKTLAGIEATDVGDSFIEQYANLGAQISSYQKQISDLENSIQK